MASSVLKSEWQGQTRLLDMSTISSREYKVIKRHTGLLMGQFEESLSGVDGMDSDVVDCLLWLFLKRSGQDNVDPATLPDYSPVEFMKGVSPVEDQSAVAEESDPKASQATGTTTSEPSSN